MTAYIVALPERTGLTLRAGGANRFVVEAASTAIAKEMVKVYFDNAIDALIDSSDTTVTAIAAATDWADPYIWNFRVAVTSPDGAVVADVTVQSSSTNDTVDEIAALLVTALNATEDIANAAYNGSTNVLSVAGTDDALGDHKVSTAAWPEGAAVHPFGIDGGFFGSITDGGMAAAALTVALAADAATVPSAVIPLKSV